jgi:hypothetical protein
MTASQIEFPLQVSVCAWCKPQTRAGEPAVISHGICLRHLKKLKLGALGNLPKRSVRSARRVAAGLESLLFSF